MKHNLLMCMMLVSNWVAAQFLITPPDGDNQLGKVTQGVGIATVTIEYHSPDVDGRQSKIWGQLVPYGKPWRVGANENTTISFSHGATVNGHEVPSGAYGLFMIPSEKDWTVIFSKTTSAWGAFVYDEKEDFLRFNVTPEPTAYHEFLTYEFTERKPDYTVVALKWEELAVPFKIEFPIHDIVVASFHEQLKDDLGLFFWEGSYEASAYCFEHDVHLDEGFVWAEQSVRIKPQYSNLMLKSRYLEKMDRIAEAKADYEMAIKMASPNDLFSLGRGLQAKDKNEEAIVIFKQNYERFGESFITHLGLGKGYEQAGELKTTLTHYKKALQLADSPRRQTAVEGYIKTIESQIGSNH